MITIFLDPRVAARVDPSDVLQETLTHAARRLPEYDDDRPGGFYPWLRQIAKDRIVDVHRRHLYAEKRSVQRERDAASFAASTSAARLVDQLIASGTSPTQHALRRERREQILEALAELPGASRELLLMRYVEQLSTREIAQSLSITESAVKSRLWRAVERMSLRLRPESEDLP